MQTETKIILENNAEVIKAAILRGEIVYSDSDGYVVINPSKDEWLIKFVCSDWCQGLTWKDGVTLNSKTFYYYK